MNESLMKKTLAFKWPIWCSIAQFLRFSSVRLFQLYGTDHKTFESVSSWRCGLFFNFETDSTSLRIIKCSFVKVVTDRTVAFQLKSGIDDMRGVHWKHSEVRSKVSPIKLQRKGTFEMQMDNEMLISVCFIFELWPLKRAIGLQLYGTDYMCEDDL